MAGFTQVAHCAGKRLCRIEALVDAAALVLQACNGLPVAALLRVADSSREPAAGRKINVHPEKVVRSLRQDLREAGCLLGVVARDHFRTPSALEKDDRLDQVGVDAAPLDSVLDHRTKRGCAPRRGYDSARTLGEQDMTQPEAGGSLIRGRAPGIERERIRSHDLTGQHEDRMSRLAVRQRIPRYRERCSEDADDNYGYA